MALELNKLTHQIDALGETLATRRNEILASLPAAREALRVVAQNPDNLDQKIQKAQTLRWTGAIPTGEPIDARFPAPPHPERADILSADGSQVYPDRHGLALYYLINIGSIVFRHGLNAAPRCTSRPEVFYQTQDLYDGENLVGTALINARRDIAELAELARLARERAPDTPALALLDNGLLLYFALQATGRKQIASVMTPYLDELDRLRESGAAVAGVVDRPRAASVIRLLRLAALDIEEINDDALRVAQPFERLSDRRLFEDLPPGHRTAVFVNASPTNTDYYQPRGHKIYFFYVNAAPAREAVILRVEVPQWIAEDPTLLDLAHAGIVEQSRVTQGFPYVLMRAHELAVVALRERGELDRMVMRAMMQRGLSPELSIKAQGKAWTGGSKRRFG